MMGVKIIMVTTANGMDRDYHKRMIYIFMLLYIGESNAQEVFILQGLQCLQKHLKESGQPIGFLMAVCMQQKKGLGSR